MLRAVLLLSLVLVAAHARKTRIIKTQYGELEGQTFQLHTGKNVSRWHGVPFAKPISPESRFQPPEKPEAWEGVRKAHRLPTACPQWPSGLIWITQPLWGNYGEDCLYMNIYAPEEPEGGPYPVMVYIHGGGWICSASIQYPGHFLAGHDVVMVAINYRVGPLGFMSTGDKEVPGNMGLLDQVAALEYIRDNIAAFGGDPNKVTLFGQSAGAASSSLHMMLPKSRGLFHQVILQSGSELAVWAINGPGQRPEHYTRDVAGRFKCPTENTKEMMDCLRKLPVHSLKDAAIDCEPGYFCQGFAPIVDGNILPDEPIKMRRRGEFMKVKIMAGNCKDDGSLYTVILVPESNNGGFNRTEFLYYLKHNLMDMFLPLAPDSEHDVMKTLDFYYSDWPALDDPDRNREVFNKIITDFGFGAGADVQFKSQSQHNDVFYYVLGYRTTGADHMYPPWMGVPHNGELPYVFGWPLLKQNPEVRWDSAIAIDIIRYDEKDVEWADYILKMWTNFAKHGDPTPEPVPSPEGNHDTNWQKYNTKTFDYLYMDHKIEYRREYRQRNFAFWHDFFPFMGDYKLYPAGEPLIKATDADDGWKTWERKRSVDNTTAASAPKPKPNGLGKKMQEALTKFYTSLAHTGIKTSGEDLLAAYTGGDPDVRSEKPEVFAINLDSFWEAVNGNVTVENVTMEAENATEEDEGKREKRSTLILEKITEDLISAYTGGDPNVRSKSLIEELLAAYTGGDPNVRSKKLIEELLAAYTGGDPNVRSKSLIEELLAAYTGGDPNVRSKSLIEELLAAYTGGDPNVRSKSLIEELLAAYTGGDPNVRSKSLIEELLAAYTGGDPNVRSKSLIEELLAAYTGGDPNVRSKKLIDELLRELLSAYTGGDPNVRSG